MAAKTTTSRPRGAQGAARNRVVFPPHARLFSSHVEGPPVTNIVRKSAEAMTAQEQQVFKSAVTKAIADGTYSRLVSIHADMAHDMHTMGGMPAGTERFLPWHRLYLVNFEQALRVFEPEFFVPHWRWMDQSSLPSWMTAFKPSGVIDDNGNPIRITRAPGTNPSARTLPTTSTIQTTVMNRSDYRSFTLALEGANPRGGAHNLVHVWFNGTMSNVSVAPADPMFWMHHAEIDRIWAVWAKAHPGQVPNLSGADAILDPWPEQVTDVMDTKVGAHSYSYDPMTL
jgi:tyrosinase